MKLIYISTACSETLLNEFLIKYKEKNKKNVQQLWDLNLSKSLFEICGENLNCFSYPPFSTFPASKCLFFLNNKTENLGGLVLKYINCINFPIVKQLCEMFYLRKKIRNIAKKTSEKIIVLTHCINYQSYKAIKILKHHFNNLFLCTIVPDLPEHMINSSFEKHIVLNNLFEIYKKKNISIKYDYDAYICFTEMQMKYLNFNVPHIVMDGFVDYKYINSLLPYKFDSKTIVYAGDISFRYGIREMINGFSNIIHTDCKLLIYGDGEAVEYIKSCGVKNVLYMGMVDKNTIISIEKGATLLVNPRPTNEEYSWCSFPSKIMEYMATGTPILTTKLNCFSSEYGKYLNYFDDLSPEGISLAVDTCLINIEELRLKASLAKEFIKNNKQSSMQAKRIIDFLKDMENKSEY